MNMMNNMNMGNNMNMMNNMGNNMNMMNNMGNNMNLMNNMNMMNNMGMGNNMNMMNIMNLRNRMNMMNNMNNNFYNNYNNMYYANMMNNINAQNMMMLNRINQNEQKIKMMQIQLNQQKKEDLMKQILEDSIKNSENNNVNIDDNNLEEQNEENQNLIDVAKEKLEQQQRFYELQPPNNINYEEVDPNFMHTFISDKTLFCGSGHNLEGKWAHGENRGGRVYNPPDGWIGFGLNVLNKYDNGNNDWLACDGRPGEWCVAYHGACVRSTSDQIKQIIKPILENNLKPGGGQAYSSYDDANHPGQKVGVGVYCTPLPNTAEGYAGIIEVNGFRYKVAFMLRVKPDKIRYSSSQSDYWVLNAGDGNFSEMRPYRFLIKKI